jgi:hypothetical protein
MGFATGFNAGWSAVSETMKDYEKQKLREGLQKISAATPQQVQGYSPEDAAQLQAMANATYINEKGERVPYYNVQSTGGEAGLGYQVSPNMEATYKGQKLYEGGINEPDRMSDAGYVIPSVAPKQFAPSTASDFLGRRFGGLGPSQEEMDATRYRAMADLIAQTDPAEAMRLRREMGAEQRAVAGEKRAISAEERTRGLYEGQLKRQGQELELGEYGVATAKDVADQRDKLRKVDESYSKWFKERVGDKAPTSDDAIAGLQWRANKLFEAGLGEEATKATQQHMVMANQRIELQTRERQAEIPQVLSALQAGDTNAAEAFYRKFVPDGANVKDIKLEKDGSYTITRETLDGTKLPPTKLKNLGELDAAIRTFADPAALSNFTQREIENNFRTRTLSIQESEAKSNKDYRAETLGLRKRELEKPTAASIVPFQDKATGETVLVDITGLPRENGVIQTPKGLTAIKGRDTSISEKDKEIFKGVEKSRQWLSAKTADEKAAVLKTNGLDPSKFGYEGRRNLYAEE